MASSHALQLHDGRDRAVQSEQRPGASSVGQRISGLLRRHWLLLIFLLAGAGLRVVVTLAYWPALELNGDSYDYLGTARTLRPSSWHPAGYPLLLRALFPAGNLGAVSVTQHVLGLCLGVLIYALLIRLGVRPWLAALGALPVLLDAYQLEIEQYVLAETLTDLFLVGGLAVLLWRRRLTGPFAAAAGILLALVGVTRDATLPVVMVVAAYLLIRRWWRALLSFCAAAAAVLIAYGLWYFSVSGAFELQSYTGVFLYGRVAPFATCNYKLTAEERKLCPSQPVSQRPYDQDYYSWMRGSPLNQRGLGSGKARNTLARKFSEQVIVHQPLEYLDAVWRDTWHYFTPGRSVARTADYMDFRRWFFPGPHLDSHAGARVNGETYPINIFFANVGFNGQKITDGLHPSLMGPLQSYQRIVYTQGPLLLAGLLGGIAVSLPLVRSTARRREARWAALVLAVSGLALTVSPSLTVGFSYRYQLPLLVLLPPAGILAADIAGDALDRIRDRRRHSVSSEPPGTPSLAIAPSARRFDGSRDVV